MPDPAPTPPSRLRRLRLPLIAGLLSAALIGALGVQTESARGSDGVRHALSRAGDSLLRESQHQARIAKAVGLRSLGDGQTPSGEEFLLAAEEMQRLHPELLGSRFVARETVDDVLVQTWSSTSSNDDSSIDAEGHLDANGLRIAERALKIGEPHLFAFRVGSDGGLEWDILAPVGQNALVLLHLGSAADFSHQLEHLNSFELMIDDGAATTVELGSMSSPAERLPILPLLQAEARFDSPLGRLELHGRRRMRLGDLSLLTRIAPWIIGLLIGLSTFAFRRMLHAERAASLRLTADQEQALRAEIVERERAEQRFEDIASSAGEYLWETDSQGKFTYLTELASEVLGRPREELLGSRPVEFIPDGERERIESWLEGVLQDERGFTHLEHRSERGDGRHIWQRVNGVPVHSESGEFRGYRGTARDITQEREAEQRAQTHRHELQLILDALPAMVFFKDDRNRILRVNRLAAENMGGSPETFEGVATERLFPADQAAAFYKDDLEVLDARRPKLGIVEAFTASSGGQRWMQTDKIPLPGPDGRLTRLVAISQDITEDRLKDSKLELAVAASGLGLWDWDVRRDEVELSDEWFRVLGLDPSSFAHDLQTWRTRMHPEDRESLQNAVTNFLRRDGRERFRTEHRLQDSKGEYRWVEVIGEVTERTEDGRPVRLTGALIDTHERKQFEQQLEEARSAAEAANRSKSEFLANMSHEIRTPMGAILGFAELLAVPDCTPEDRTAHVATIQRNGEHLLSLLGDILDLSKIEAGRMSIATTATSPVLVLREVLDLVRPTATEKGLTLELEIDPDVPTFIETDPVRLRQVIVNLVGNAVKFTSVGSVDISACLKEGKLFIEVRDTGPGLDAQQAQRIFAPFVQADESITRRFGGTGLGLAISRRLARMLGGDIEVQSKPGIGSSFTASFEATLASLPGSNGAQRPFGGPSGPAAIERKLGSTGIREVALQLVGKHILLVEDGRDNQLLISRFLQRSGATVEVAGNGLLAVERLRSATQERGFDLVLMDMQMPVLDGYSATVKLREKGFELPIIALTAHAMIGDEQRCLDAGCDAYLTKPVKRQALVRACLEQLRKKAA